MKGWGYPLTSLAALSFTRRTDGQTHRERDTVTLYASPHPTNYILNRLLIAYPYLFRGFIFHQTHFPELHFLGPKQLQLLLQHLILLLQLPPQPLVGVRTDSGDRTCALFGVVI